jgi:flagella basal body P-ring formation protein FlgA
MKTALVFLLSSFYALGAVTARDPKAELKQALQEQIGSGVRLQVERVFVSGAIPEGARLIVTEGNSALGAVSFRYEYLTRYGLSSIPGNAVVKGYAKVAIATAPIRNGDSFSTGNVKFEERELSKLMQSGYYADWKQLERLTAVGYVRPEQIISSFHTVAARAVSPGQWIDVIHEKGALRVTARMKALESGQKNQWIRAENPSSKRVVQIKVIGDGQGALR